jgi:probable HAF family extracellular repeat protein
MDQPQRIRSTRMTLCSSHLATPRRALGTLRPRLGWGALGWIVVGLLALTASALPAVTIVDLGVLPGGSFSYASAINSRGQVIGQADTADGSFRAARWDP